MNSTAATVRVILARYTSSFSRRSFVISFILAFVMLTAGFIIGSYAVGYATESASNPVTDLILSNFQVVDVDGIFVNGAMLMVLFMAVVCIIDPRRVPFVIKTIAVFVVIRSLFIILTHIGAFPTQSTINPSTQNLIEDVIGIKLYASFFLGNDSFFSGHTGLPFLMAFLYWDKKWIRNIFIALSVMFGIVVLIGHLHYTIDVLSAFFISYGIYRMSRHLFPTDMQREEITENK